MENVEFVSGYQPLASDIEQQSKQAEEFQVAKFLTGLDPAYQSIHGLPLAIDNPLSLSNVNARLQ